MALTAEQKDWRKLRAAFKELTCHVAATISRVDAEMKKPPTIGRGERVADLMNQLEIFNDIARRSVLGERR